MGGSLKALALCTNSDLDPLPSAAKCKYRRTSWWGRVVRWVASALVVTLWTV